MKTFIVFTDTARFNRRNLSCHLVTKRHVITADSLSDASKMALAVCAAGAVVSMIWEKWPR